MATFPPKGARSNPPTMPSYDCPPASTGKGGIARSLKIKAAGTKNAPGLEKTVSNF